MMVERRFKRMRIVTQPEYSLVHIGEMEIWDGADLALLREGLTWLIEKEKLRTLAIDMAFVKYIPSGFFGMLYDWREKRNIEFWLKAPQPNVQSMLWFRQFFPMVGDNLYHLDPAAADASKVIPDWSEEEAHALTDPA